LNKNFILSKLADAIDQSKWDEGRNQYLLKRIKQEKEIANSDKLYLEKIFGIKISNVKYDLEKKKKKISKKIEAFF